MTLKGEVVTPIHLKSNTIYLETSGDAVWQQLIVCCEAVRSVILATAGLLVLVIIFCLFIIRPPGTVVPEGFIFYNRCLFLVSPQDLRLRAPSTDRRETLPHDLHLDEF